jgi:anti-repressor protein
MEDQITIYTSEYSEMMTVKEVSSVLEVAETTVLKYIKKLFPDKLHSGKKCLLNEAEVTAVKLKLQQNQQLARSQELPKTDLIKVEVNSYGVETVNAKDLHDFLKSKQRFADWIVNRIATYAFGENIDFIITTCKSNGGRPSKEYHLTIDMAKELSMVERNEKGREIRQWFIARENKLSKLEISAANPPLLPDFNDPVAAARAWANAKEAELKAKQNLLEAQPKIEFYETVGNAQGLHTVAEAAKLLGTGRNRLFSWMRTYKILRENNEPYQKYIEAGYFEVKENPTGDYLNTQTFVTPTGLQWLQKCREKNLVEVIEWADKNNIKL